MVKSLRPVVRLFAAKKRRALLLGALLAAATVLAGVGLLGLSGWFITATSLAGLSAATAVVFDVFAPSAGIRLLAIGRTASRYGERLVTHDATLAVLAALREKLFRGWARPDAAAELRRQPAKLLFRLTADIDALDTLYLRVMIPAGVAVLSALSVTVALGLMDPLFGVAAGLWLCAAGLGIPVVAGRLAVRHARRRAHAMEALRARAIDLVVGQTDLAMAGRLPAQHAAVMDADRRLNEADDRLNRIESVVTAGFGMVSTILLSGALVAVASLARTGMISAPVAAFGVLVALTASEPFTGLRRGTLELGRTVLAARRIAPRLEDEGASQPLPTPDGEFALTMTSVVTRHPAADGGAPVDIVLSLAPGTCLAITGASGAGKSMLLGAIAGEIVPESGSIAALKSTTLTQRTELFQDTLRENLRLADPKADDGALRQAIDAAGLKHVVQALPAGLMTPLGEGGLGLSGGQSRRLALARLFLTDTRLWLLDEPTEGLDGETARDVMRRLVARSGGRAVVIATHIRREAEIADNIALLDRGRIVATARRGTTEFDALLARLRPD